MKHINGKLAAVSAVLALALAAGTAFAATDNCRECHRDPKFRVQNKKIYDYYKEWEGSTHDIAGLECTSCHTGDPASTTKEAAHKGILSTANADSPIHYKNIPKTCGKCHEAIYTHFTRSKHFALLEKSGKGPNCITCHGSLNARTYYTTIFDRACSMCHNEETGNRPDIVPKGKNILSRINHSKGYRTGLRFYYESIKKPGAMKKVDSLYEDIVRAWHEFNFERMDGMSNDLVDELKALYNKAQAERTAREEATGGKENP